MLATEGDGEADPVGVGAGNAAVGQNLGVLRM